MVMSGGAARNSRSAGAQARRGRGAGGAGAERARHGRGGAMRVQRRRGGASGAAAASGHVEAERGCGRRFARKKKNSVKLTRGARGRVK